MSVFKRNKVWYYRFCIRGIRYGQAVPEARTKWQAEQAETKAKEEIFEGRYCPEPSNISLKEFVEKEFIPWSKREKRSWRNDQSRVKPILAYFRNKKMREISRFNVEQFKRERRESQSAKGGRRSPASVDRELQLLSRIYSLAIEQELLQVNPCTGVKLCGVSNLVPRFLSEEDEAKLLPMLVGRRKHLLDILLVDTHTGMRRTELLSLHRSQVDLVRSTILLLHTKNGKQRTVPIHPNIHPILERLCDKAGPSGYLFENPKTGKPIKDIKTAWRKALELAGIPHIPFHCAGRHTFGTRAAEGGAHPKDIQEIMDHVNIATTMRYVHATDPGKLRAIEAAARGGKKIPATNLPQTKEATG
ncbi:MAG TPA: site-specific integrase [Blastocatellia bacterium]|nr:site-specific integrase [Blastocatellia bacterium]